MGKTKEEKFNFWFSAFLLACMVIVTIINFIFKINNPNVNLVMQVLASLGAIMGVTNTVLSANGSIWTFLFGIIDVAIGTIVYYDSGIMGNFALHAFYFLPMQFVGLWQWSKRGAKMKATVDENGEQSHLKARRLTPKQWGLVAAAFVIGVAVTFTILYFVDKASLAKGAISEISISKILLDSTVMVLNILGQVLLSLAFMEQWYLWILVNIFSIMLWTNRLISPEATGYTIVMLIKYILYLMNSLNGLRIWLKLSRSQEYTHA